MRAMSKRMIGMMIPTRKVVLSGSVVISADHLDSLNISLVVYALILNLIDYREVIGIDIFVVKFLNIFQCNYAK